MSNKEGHSFGGVAKMRIPSVQGPSAYSWTRGAKKPYDISRDFEMFCRKYYRSIGPGARQDPDIQALLKADDRYDFGSTDYFDPAYSARVTLEALVRSTDIYKLLPKTTYITEGDSMQYIKAEDSGLRAFLGDETAMFGGDTYIPDITAIDRIWPAVFASMWEDTRVATELSKVPGRSSKVDLQTILDYKMSHYLNAIDMQLAGTYLSTTVHGVDTPATSTMATVECIDRMLSNGTESGATNHVGTATDGNIFWGKTNITGTDTIVFERAADAAPWANAQVKLPSVAATEEAYNLLDELDDLMAVAKQYAPSDQRNYIGLCSDKALNKIQNELDPKSRVMLEGNMEVTQTLNGVSTRPGVVGGKISTQALMITGVKVPFFTSTHFSGTATSGWLWKNQKYTTGGVGNIYLVNLDNIEIRHLIPITHEVYPNFGDWILGNRHVIFSGMQLLCRNFASHAALKYIKA